MPNQAWAALLNTPAPIVDGAALANSTTLTAITPNTTTSPQLIIPANFLVPGQALRVTASGRLSVTATPTLLIGAYLGGVALCAITATAMASGVTNMSWRFRADIVVRSIGTAGTVMATGEFAYGTSATAVALLLAPATAPAVSGSIDTTAAQALDVRAQWSAASASNTITAHQYLVEALN